MDYLRKFRFGEDITRNPPANFMHCTQHSGDEPDAELGYIAAASAATSGAENTVESVSDVVAGLRHHRRQLLSQLELLSDDHHPAEILQRRFPFRHCTGGSAASSVAFCEMHERQMRETVISSVLTADDLVIPLYMPCIRSRPLPRDDGKCRTGKWLTE